MKLLFLWFKTVLLFCCLFFNAEFGIAQHSVAREWNEIVLEAIRNDFARPTVHARNLYQHSIIAYDIWAAYEPTKDTYFLGKFFNGYYCDFSGVNLPLDVESAKHEAISHASYFFLMGRYQSSPSFFNTYTLMYNYMVQHGYNVNNTSTDYVNGGPAELGNYLAQEMMNYAYNDGSNELLNYENTFYAPINPPLIMAEPGNPDIIDPNRWQSLTLDSAIDQSGNNVQSTVPFISPEWGNVTPFALESSMSNVRFREGNAYNVYFDTVQPAYLDLNDSSAWESFYKWNHSLVSIWQSHLDPTDGVMWDISPASIGNNTWYPSDSSEYAAFYDMNGGDPSTGYSVNPVTGQPYTPQIVPRGDYARVLAEFWADGIDSETPPGHWFEIYHYVTDQPTFERKWEGTGPELDALEYDVKAHLTLGGTMHDAAISAWSLKGFYDYLRPVSAIRYMVQNGQSSDASLSSYHPNGVPLMPGYIEIVDSLDPLAGMNYENVGKIKLYTWKGHDFINDPLIDVAGVGWILGETWWPYQRPTFVTPPFAGFVSGHSTFSRAAAGILEKITGSPYFPGGLGEFTAIQNEFLHFEEGPSTTITLQWASYRDAADQCSLSRIWGGIHPPVDDIPGRMIGGQIGDLCFNKADSIFSISQASISFSTLSDTIINSYDSGTSMTLNLSFNVPMDITTTPQVVFAPGNVYQVLEINQMYWIDSFQLQVDIDINNNIIEQFSTMITIQGVDAANGMHLPEINLEDYFIIDTKQPELMSFEGNTFVLSDENLLSGFQTTLQFDEPCNVSLIPSIIFSGADYLNPSITENQSSWNSTQEYVSSFSIQDFNENVSNVNVLIENIEDIHGNPLLNPNQSDICSIDTRNPSTSVLLLSDTLINIEDLNNNPQVDVVIQFDETMNTNVIPELSLFDGNILHESILMNPFATYWSDSSTLNSELWVLFDTNDFTEFDVICTEAYDINGNIISDSITTSHLYSDLKKPTVEYTLPITTMITDSIIGSSTYYVDVSFNEKMDVATTPLVIHESVDDLSGSLHFNLMESIYTTDSTFRAFFNVLDDHIEADSIDIQVLFGNDFAGNIQIPYAENAMISIDTKNPSITSFNVSSNILNIGDQIDMTLEFDEEMDTNQIISFEFNPFISAPVELVQTNYAWMNTTSANVAYELMNTDANPYYFDLNIIDGTDKAGNLLIPYGADTVFTIPGSLGFENEMESIHLYPNIISSGGFIGFTGNIEEKLTKNIKVLNSGGENVGQVKFNRIGKYWYSFPIHLPPGVYFIYINYQTYRFVVI